MQDWPLLAVMAVIGRYWPLLPHLAIQAALDVPPGWLNGAIMAKWVIMAPVPWAPQGTIGHYWPATPGPFLATRAIPGGPGLPSRPHLALTGHNGH